MLRAGLAAALAIALSGCWGSEKNLFQPADFVRPDDLSGTFASTDGTGKIVGTVILTPRKDGRFDAIANEKGEAKPKESVVGFVATAHEKGPYFIMVNDLGLDKEGEIYLLARWDREKLDVYWPECPGTPDIPGLVRQGKALGVDMACAFTTKASIMRAAALAAGELAAPHIVPPQIMGRLRREATGAAGEEMDEKQP